MKSEIRRVQCSLNGMIVAVAGVIWLVRQFVLVHKKVDFFEMNEARKSLEIVNLYVVCV